MVEWASEAASEARLMCSTEPSRPAEVGIPLAVWATRVYLERFAYRVEGYGWVFVVAVIISLAIAFGTVLWQTSAKLSTQYTEK